MTIRRILILISILYCSSCSKESKGIDLNNLMIDYNFRLFNVYSLPDVFGSTPSISKDTKLLVVYLFDGGCSICIKEYMEWVRFFNENIINEEVFIINISTNGNTSTIKYYLEKFNIPFENNYLKYCRDDCPDYFYDKPTSVYLVDKNLNLVLKGNPLKSKPIINYYRKNNIIL